MSEAMGHGVNQRGIIKMTPAEVDGFLAGRRPMSMCTLNHDGTIHAVAMWYGFLEGAVAFETKAKSQKVQNLRRDPRLTLLFEDGDTYEELRGVELVGKAEIIDDPDKLWELGISQGRAGEIAEQADVAVLEQQPAHHLHAAQHRKRVELRHQRARFGVREEIGRRDHLAAVRLEPRHRLVIAHLALR